MTQITPWLLLQVVPSNKQYVISGYKKVQHVHTPALTARYTTFIRSFTDIYLCYITTFILVIPVILFIIYIPFEMFSSCLSLALSALFCRNYLTSLQRIWELYRVLSIFWHKLIQTVIHAFHPFMYNDLSFVLSVCQLKLWLLRCRIYRLHIWYIWYAYSFKESLSIGTKGNDLVTLILTIMLKQTFYRLCCHQVFL